MWKTEFQCLNRYDEVLLEMKELVRMDIRVRVLGQENVISNLKEQQAAESVTYIFSHKMKTLFSKVWCGYKVPCNQNILLIVFCHITTTNFHVILLRFYAIPQDKLVPNCEARGK